MLIIRLRVTKELTQYQLWFNRMVYSHAFYQTRIVLRR